MFCIYKTDPEWIKNLRELRPDVLVNFWRKGKGTLNLPIGSWFYFNERRTRNIVGRGILVGYEILTIEQAWGKFGIGNGVKTLVELESRASSILHVSGDGAEIGCILLSELQFLEHGKEFVVSHEDYPKQIVGPKYFEDNELPKLAAAFSTPTSLSSTAAREPGAIKYLEGNESFSYRVGYERNPEARRACLDHYGYTCIACNTNMQELYGDIAREFIHVHHLSPIAEAGGAREVDPVKDLVPLCPNCHSVAHRRAPPFSVDELKALLADPRRVQ